MVCDKNSLLFDGYMRILILSIFLMRRVKRFARTLFEIQELLFVLTRVVSIVGMEDISSRL